MIIKEKEKTTKKDKVIKNVAEVKEVSFEEQIQLWKDQFGGVYKNTIDGEVIIWRSIRRAEYRELLRSDEELDSELRLLAKQEKTVLMATLHPTNMTEIIERKAGLATVLSEEILAKSGFDISETETL